MCETACILFSAVFFLHFLLLLPILFAILLIFTFIVWNEFVKFEIQISFDRRSMKTGAQVSCSRRQQLVFVRPTTQSFESSEDSSQPPPPWLLLSLFLLSVMIFSLTVYSSVCSSSSSPPVALCSRSSIPIYRPHQAFHAEPASG